MVQTAMPFETMPVERRPELPQLRGLLEQWERPAHRERRAVTSIGAAAVDRLLPGRGLRDGMLVEWIADGPGSGVSLLPVMALRELQKTSRGAVVVVDREGHFYPPAAAAWGIDLSDMMLLRPTTAADELWAIDQALRCPDVATVLAWPPRIDGFTFRRLQLAAEASGAIGLLVRPRSAREEPTWATARLLVSPLPSLMDDEFMDDDDELPTSWRLEVTVLKSRGARANQSVQLEVDEQTGKINELPTQHAARARHLAAELARRAAHEQTA